MVLRQKCLENQVSLEEVDSVSLLNQRSYSIEVIENDSAKHIVVDLKS